MRSTRGGAPPPRQQPRQQARAQLRRTNPLAGDSAQAARQAKVAAIVQVRRARATDSAQAARQARRPTPVRRAPAGIRTPQPVYRKQAEAGIGAPVTAGAGLLEKIASNLAQDAYYTPAGLYQAGKAVYHDTGATLHGDYRATQSRRLGKQIGEQTLATVEHPLRRPGDTLLLGWTAASLGAGGVARLGAAGRALEEGGVGAALARPGAEGGSLLHAPHPGRIALHQGDLSVDVPAFRNPLARAIQRGYHGLQARHPEGIYAGRLPLLPEQAQTVGRALSNERRVTEPLERAPAGELAARGHRLTTAQQTALRVVYEGQPVEKRIQFHLERAKQAKPAERRDHLYEVGLLRAARKYVDETSGKPTLKESFRRPLLAHGVVPRPGVGADELKAIHGLGLKVAGEREGILAEAGREVPEGRVHAPGQVIEGNYRRGESPQLALGEQRDIKVGESPPLAHLPTPTIEKRLAGLDKRYGELVDRLSRQYDAQSARGITASRNIVRGRAARGSKREVLPTVRDEARSLVERHLLKMLESHPDEPSVQRFVRELDQAKALREELTTRQDRVIEGHGASVARAHYEPLTEPEPFQGGEARVPYTPTLAPRSHGQAAQYRGGVPRAPGSVTHEFTGQLLKTGNFRKQTTKLMAESHIEAQRYGAALRLRDRILKAAHDERAEGDIPVRLDSLKSQPFPASLRGIEAKLAEGAKLSRDERKAAGDAYEKLRQHIFPAEPVAGVKFVNEKLLAGMNQPGVPLHGLLGHGLVGGFDALNNAQRMAILYLKPAYAVPNVGGNLWLNLVQQGFAAPANLTRAALANARLGKDAATRLDAVMGEGFVHAITPEGGAGTKIVQKAASVWSKGVDLPFRRASFIHEARKLGYKTPERIRSLLLDDKHRPDLVEASQRANRAIIDYGRMSQREREIVRRVIFFYPWVKGSTMYAGHFITEHPVQAAANAELGRVGQQQAQKDLGAVPSFAEGIFKVGQRGKTPLVSNPASAAILGQPAQVAETAVGTLRGNTKQAFQLAQYLTPAAQLGISELTGRDTFTGAPLRGNLLRQFVDQQTSGLPQTTLYKRLTQDQTGKLYPLNKHDAELQFGVGTVAPRPVNLDKLHGFAASEQRAGMSRVGHALDDGRKLREQFVAQAVKTGIAPKGLNHLSPELSQAIILRTKRYANYAAAGVKSGSGTYERDAFTADVNQLLRWGKIKPADKQRSLAWLKTASDPQIRYQRKLLGEEFYGTATISAAKNEINDAGGDIR